MCGQLEAAGGIINPTLNPKQTRPDGSVRRNVLPVQQKSMTLRYSAVAQPG